MSWIDLDGAVNVRDVGGLPTVDGRTTRPGVLLRADNLARHLRVRPRGLPPPGCAVVLLDDVLTTGATARAATARLAAAGRPVDVVVVLTLADRRAQRSLVRVGTVPGAPRHPCGRRDVA